jgi:hypothetical protein
LAPNRENLQATRALRNKAPKRTYHQQIHKQTNKSYVDTGSNPIVLALQTPSSSLLAMANETSPAPRPQGMSDGPLEDPPTGTQKAPPQQATTRPTAVACLGNRRRSHALKMLIAAVLSHKAQNQRHNALKKWIHYTKTKINTANLAARTVHTFYAEALRKWQCLRFHSDLKGLVSEIHTITGPYLVTRRQLHETIADITSTLPQEQHLASIHHHADAHNADLLYMDKGTTLQLLLHLNGDSGSSRPSSIGPHEHAKPLTHQTLEFHICVNGPDQHQNALRVLLNDKIDQLNESLEERVDPPPSYQTLFRHRQQLDDDLRPDSGNSDEMNYDDDKSPTNGKAGAAAHPPL